MNLKLNCEQFEKYIDYAIDHPIGDGVQYVFKFDNRYGASVIKTTGSYGHENDLWELAVTRYKTNGKDWRLCYDTEITDDVIGNLNDEEVNELLERIKGL